MTPDQEEAWKAAVMPIALGVIEGHEFTEQGLNEAERRLEQHNTPRWASRARHRCIERMQQEHSPYLPTFAIRCEVAMVGISLLYPDPGQCHALYKNLFRTFLQEALLPLVKRVEQADDPRRRRAYQPLMQIYRLCNNPTLSVNQRKWADLELDASRFEGAYLHPEITALHELIRLTIRLAHNVLVRSADRYFFPLVDRFISLLSAQHQWQLEGNVESASSYAHLPAQVFLTTLETVCPEPDWMPRV